LTQQFQDNHESTFEQSHQNDLFIGSTVVRITIFDTGGNPSLDVFRRQWCRQGDAFILVFDTTSRKSFELLKQFYAKIIESGRRKSPCSLGGTVTDLGEQVVTMQEVARRAAEFDAAYFYLSVKDTTIPQQPFKCLAYRDFQRGLEMMTLVIRTTEKTRSGLPASTCDSSAWQTSLHSFTADYYLIAAAPAP
jgi:GTPase SAR1 family protein